MINAVLTEVYAPGPVDRSGKRLAEGDLVWSGTLRCYLRRAAKIVTVGGNLTKVEYDQMVINGRMPVQITEGADLEGSVLTIDDQRDGSQVRKFRVAGVQKLAAASVADSVRIELTQERA